ncbi:hypothetical protein X474_01350 [Dethiosulfatarculus sandiegensis]|uniref:Uncharacterized protein n=1 Tax=Dethiosulfatarculus sandiegensis TaxID=1429043 RepID=A0A0D2K3H7_9BACT|nr:hypothetical protein X474_01350 [Dethiosulfatarculus sandiegensis]
MQINKPVKTCIFTGFGLKKGPKAFYITYPTLNLKTQLIFSTLKEKKTPFCFYPHLALLILKTRQSLSPLPRSPTQNRP